MTAAHVTVNMVGGIVPWSIAQLTVAYHFGAPGAHAHCPVEVWARKLAPEAALSLLQPMEGEIARGHSRKPPTARPLNAQ